MVPRTLATRKRRNSVRFTVGRTAKTPGLPHSAWSRASPSRASAT
jgi:hypothetical protein